MPEADSDGAARPHILIVDDLPADLGVLFGVLDGAGYEVLVATSGEGALARLAYMQPDLILLDVNMPGLDGYETCRQLKADARWREVPVLFLTAQDDPVDKVRGFEAGAVDYITKPLHTEEVLARVRTHLQIRWLQQALAEKKRTTGNRDGPASGSRGAAPTVAGPRCADGGHRRSHGVLHAAGAPIIGTLFPRTRGPGYAPFAASHLAGGRPGPVGGPWRTEQAESWLEVHLFTSGQPGAALMVLLEEKPKAIHSPARLLQLGLTVREAEVLYWAAHGKSNQEVATILSASLNTIKKHVANLLVKMGAETRLTAALQAAEILELRAVEPIKLRTPSGE